MSRTAGVTDEQWMKKGAIPPEEHPYNIPESWIWVKLGSVVKLMNGFAFKSSDYVTDGIPIIRISDVKGTDTNTDKAVKVPREQFQHKFAVQKGDLLIAMSGATTGKVGIYNSEETAMLNQRVGNLKEIEPNRIDRKYKNYFIKHVSPEIMRLAYGGAQPNISAALIESIPIPLPPIEEQQRIANRIEHLLEKLSQAKQFIEQSRQSFQKRRAAIMREAFSGNFVTFTNKIPFALTSSMTLHVPDHWQQLTIKDATDNYNNKRVPITKHARVEGNTPYYGATGIVDYVDGYTHDGQFVLIGEDGANLLSRSKDQAFQTSGKVWINNHAHVLSMKDGMSNDYLMHYLNYIPLHDFITGTAQPKLTRGKLDMIPIPVPPQREQELIAEKLELLLGQEMQAAEQLEQTSDATDRLEKSILNAAFQGEL